MPTDSASRTLIVITLLGVLAWCVWLIRDVLPPFLISLALALLLDPVIDRMQRRGLPRSVAVAIAFAVVMGAVVSVSMAVLPRAIGQVADLTRNIDVYSVRVEGALDHWAQEHGDELRRLGLPPTVNALWREHQAEITHYLQGWLQSAFLSLQGVAGALGWLLIIPIVTLYLMIDLDALKARIQYVIPRQHRPMVQKMSLEVGRVFAAYVRGLIAVCLGFGLSIYIVLGLMFGMEYAVIFALAAVVLYAIPYLGQLTLLITAVLGAWATGHTGAYMVGVGVCLVLVGQLFDQLITPRVMGKQVGLHPVLGVFALMVGGNLFGLPGMVIAVPAAASIRVVLIQLFPRLGEPLPGYVTRKKGLFRREVREKPPEPRAALDAEPREALEPEQEEPGREAADGKANETGPA